MHACTRMQTYTHMRTLTHAHTGDKTILQYVTGPAEINHVSTKTSPIFLSLLYHNLQTKHNKISITATVFNGLFLKFAEIGYHIQS